MLNCARRPRINNCILKFVFGHFRAVCSVYRATKFLFGGCFTNPRRKYDFFPDSVEVNIFFQSLFSCNLVLSHLFPIACGTFSKLFILKEWSVFPRKNFHHSLSASPSEWCGNIGCLPHSWLTTGENRLAKFVFVLLFSFLKHKRKQDEVRGCTKIIKIDLDLNDWRCSLSWSKCRIL